MNIASRWLSRDNIDDTIKSASQLEKTQASPTKTINIKKLTVLTHRVATLVNDKMLYITLWISASASGKIIQNSLV